MLDRSEMGHLLLLTLDTQSAMRCHLVIPMLLDLILLLLLLYNTLLLLVYLGCGRIDISARLGLMDARGVGWGMLDVRYRGWALLVFSGGIGVVR